jgi:hypothetical protein
LRYLESSYPQVLKDIPAKKQIDDGLRATMTTAAGEFIKGFKAK